jgi:hypothetical protein
MHFMFNNNKNGHKYTKKRMVKQVRIKFILYLDQMNNIVIVRSSPFKGGASFFFTLFASVDYKV